MRGRLGRKARGRKGCGGLLRGWDGRGVLARGAGVDVHSDGRVVEGGGKWVLVGEWSG